MIELDLLIANDSTYLTLTDGSDVSSFAEIKRTFKTLLPACFEKDDVPESSSILQKRHRAKHISRV